MSKYIATEAWELINCDAFMQLMYSDDTYNIALQLLVNCFLEQEGG